LTVLTLIEDDRWEKVGLSLLAEAAEKAVAAALKIDLKAFEISILACSDARIAVLNADFRGKPVATNVLSWPSAERGAQVDGGRPLAPRKDPFGMTELGDIAIAYDTCLAEAETAHKSMTDHVTHLIVHGTLHLLGYDHERDADAALMEGLETRILESMGLQDPYNG
jgi:probable rRNA maturation factor